MSRSDLFFRLSANLRRNPNYRQLSIGAKALLSILTALAAGDNEAWKKGKLWVTYAGLATFGLRRASIKRYLDELRGAELVCVIPGVNRHRRTLVYFTGHTLQGSSFVETNADDIAARLESWTAPKKRRKGRNARTAQQAQERNAGLPQRYHQGALIREKESKRREVEALSTQAQDASPPRHQPEPHDYQESQGREDPDLWCTSCGRAQLHAQANGTLYCEICQESQGEIEPEDVTTKYSVAELVGVVADRIGHRRRHSKGRGK